MPCWRGRLPACGKHSTVNYISSPGLSETGSQVFRLALNAWICLLPFECVTRKWFSWLRWWPWLDFNGVYFSVSLPFVPLGKPVDWKKFWERYKYKSLGHFHECLERRQPWGTAVLKEETIVPLKGLTKLLKEQMSLESNGVLNPIKVDLVNQVGLYLNLYLNWALLLAPPFLVCL